MKRTEKEAAQLVEIGYGEDQEKKGQQHKCHLDNGLPVFRLRPPLRTRRPSQFAVGYPQSSVPQVVG